MSGSRPAIWATVTGFALLVLAGAWFVTTHDRELHEERGRPTPAALRNPWLATQMLLERFGYRVATSREAGTLDQLPGGGTVILSSERQYHLTPSRTAALLAWVEAGGLLIADASGVSASDPILTAFEVRLTAPVAQDPAKVGDDEDEGEDATAAKPTPKQRREPARRIVDVPGYGRELRMRASGAALYPGSIAPAWQAAGDADRRGRIGFEILAFERGEGQVVLVNGLWRFGRRESLARDDHAEILLAMIATHQRDGDIRILTRLDTPTLFEWLWDHAKPLLASAGVLFAFWLWRIVPRFGVIRSPAPPQRRSLVAHLRAVGRFLWRQRAAAVLLDAARANVKRRLVQRGLTSPEPNAAPPIAHLAHTLGLREGDIALALSGAPANDHQYVAAMATLHDLSRKLNETADH